MNNRFKYRLPQEEMMDNPQVDKGLLFKNLHELDVLNEYSGVRRNSLSSIKKIIGDKSKEYHIVDLGCGSGDTLKYLAEWARKEGYKIYFTGVDNNKNAIEYLRNHCCDYPEITGVCMGWNQYLQRADKIDIVYCSLFCHHLPNDELRILFETLKRRASVGFVINDLLRSALAYYATVLFTKLANATPLAKNDGPISVLNGFKKREIVTLLEQVEIKHYHFEYKLGFRFLLTVVTEARS